MSRADEMALNFFLFGGLPQLKCDSYGTLGMTLQEVYEATRHPSIQPYPKDEKCMVTGYAVLNLKTGEIKVFDKR